MKKESRDLVASTGHLRVNSENRCKVVVLDELGRELEHFNWALFRRFIADSRSSPLLSICKSVNLKTETD